MEFSDASLERLYSVNDLGSNCVKSPSDAFDWSASGFTLFIFWKKKNFSGNIFGTSGENVSHPKRLCFSCVVATHVTLRFTDEAIQAITTSFDS